MSSRCTRRRKKSSRSHRFRPVAESDLRGHHDFAPGRGAVSTAARIWRRLPSKSPTVCLSCATAISWKRARPLARLELDGRHYKNPPTKPARPRNPRGVSPPTGIASRRQSQCPTVPRFAPRERLRVAAHRLEPAIPSLWDGDRLVGAAPLYVKAHSYGSTSSTGGWADAYERTRGPYTRSSVRVPFTPATGGAPWREAGCARGAKALLRFAAPTGSRRCTFLFPRDEDAAALRDEGCSSARGSSSIGVTRLCGLRGLPRRLSHDKRKKIRGKEGGRRGSDVRRSRARGARGRLDFSTSLPATYRSTARRRSLTPRILRPARRAHAGATCCW